MSKMKLTDLNGGYFYIVDANITRIILEQDTGGNTNKVIVINSKIVDKDNGISILEAEST